MSWNSKSIGYLQLTPLEFQASTRGKGAGLEGASIAPAIARNLLVRRLGKSHLGVGVVHGIDATRYLLGKVEPRGI